MKLPNKGCVGNRRQLRMGRVGALLFALEGAKVAAGDIDQRAAAK